MIKLQRARSLLYRGRFLRSRSHFLAFFEIYKILTPLHLSELKILEKFVKFFYFFKSKSAKNRYFSTNFIKFCIDSDEIFSEFRRKPQKMLNFPEISKFAHDFQSTFLNAAIILTEFWSFKDSNYSIGRQPNLSTLTNTSDRKGAQAQDGMFPRRQ